MEQRGISTVSAQAQNAGRGRTLCGLGLLGLRVLVPDVLVPRHLAGEDAPGAVRAAVLVWPTLSADGRLAGLVGEVLVLVGVVLDEGGASGAWCAVRAQRALERVERGGLRGRGGSDGLGQSGRLDLVARVRRQDARGRAPRLVRPPELAVLEADI